jgi:hypothetical protein
VPREGPSDLLPAAVRKRDRRCVAKKVRGAAIRRDLKLKGGGLTQSGRRIYKPARPLQTGVSLSAPTSFTSNRKHNVAAHPKRLAGAPFLLPA